MFAYTLERCYFKFIKSLLGSISLIGHQYDYVFDIIHSVGSTFNFNILLVDFNGSWRTPPNDNSKNTFPFISKLEVG